MSDSATTAELAPPCTPSPCCACGLTLPIRTRAPGEVSQVFLCVRCGERQRGVYIEEAPQSIATNALRSHQPQDNAAASLVIQSAPKRTAKQAVCRDPMPACDATSRTSKKLDLVLTQPEYLEVRNQGPAFSASITQHGAAPYEPEVLQEQLEVFQDSVEQVERLVATLEKGDSINPEAHESLTHDSLRQASSDLDSFVRLGLNPRGDGYPGRHSLHVSMLATAIGATMGWDHNTLVELGVGCLIHDLGMMLTPDKVYQSNDVLSDEQYNALATHPINSFELIDDHVATVPLASRMVAYQIHERANASGYPRRRPAPLIHQAAKVAAVADVYVALVSPRPHRAPLMPYYAVEHLLQGVRSGLFEAGTVRALLKTISLFPIGSCVQLSDNRVARVLRSSPTDYTRPIVEAWRPAELDAPPEIIDLSQQADLSVLRAVATLQGE